MVVINKKLKAFVEVVRDIVIIVCIFFSIYTVVRMTMTAKQNLVDMEKRMEVTKKAN